MTSFAAPLMNCNMISKIEPHPVTGRIFNIQRYSLHDGSGIRTVVFFKGCPLRCPWCANPESRSHRTTFQRNKAKCIQCKTCAMDVDECPSGAWQQVGTDMTVDDVIAEVTKDDIFFTTSHGGITLSGGEVLSQAKFAIALLEKLKTLGYQTAIETSGHGNAKHLIKIAKLCDQVLFDFKIMDPDKAKTIIGIHLEHALDNFKQLAEHKIHLVPRLPLIPGYTMDLINIDKILDYLRPFKLTDIHLLPFHQYGAAKYQTLGIEYQLQDVPAPSNLVVENIRQHIAAHGYHVIIGG
ncbi:[formate-C-acetyltransferase]-activating enzyme [Vibrio aquimaris]|uniref:Benzylsuccinate synthase activating enzyme n=1 Tax=Vibrio aquimaris TaxID=2587862 RepID=A0A5P9CI43_9VIBR|nr:[formate-C-acetyltransferase]-activating enzyme [Vibrio aquimaris]QFT25924.1 Benzylsuccinate synthase activating enzyme [Vibrio aquimaris]